MVSPVYPGTPASPGLNSVGGLGALGGMEDDWLAAPGGNVLACSLLFLSRARGLYLLLVPIFEGVESGWPFRMVGACLFPLLWCQCHARTLVLWCQGSTELGKGLVRFEEEELYSPCE